MRLSDILELTALGAVWGASFLFMRIAVPEFGPVALVEVRIAIGALFLLPIFLLKADVTELKQHWGKLTLLSAMNSVAPFVLLTYSTVYITGGLAAILNATAPIWAAMVAWIWLSERLTMSQMLGLLVGFVGVALLVWNKASLTLDGTTLALLAGIGAAMLYAIAGNFAKKRMSDINPLAIATGTMIAGAILLLPAAIYTWPDEPVSTRSWVAAIIMGIVSTGIAYIMYFRLIRNVGPTKAIAVTYLIPVFAMFWGALVIDEQVTNKMIVGCGIIFLGTALATGMLRLGRK